MLLMQGNLQFPAVGFHYSFYVSFLGMSFRESFKENFPVPSMNVNDWAARVLKHGREIFF